ncbi:MAG: hypothetical protein ACYTG0_16295 [Planctomycetota bacterium]
MIQYRAAAKQSINRAFIFWMDVWMDLSGNVFWGTGDTYFGNIDREAGTMSGIVFEEEGGVLAFSGIADS